ncbi:MAG: insulinase family protein [Alphaproteobacteria bacterium]|nr:insulinase family protein [Alphaproteobacteria bacterium]MCB9793392.1 insulinase family protein [Alphaproteobacteria bacterium]
MLLLLSVGLPLAHAADPPPLLHTDAQVRVLDNGLTVLVEEQRRTDVVAIELMYGVGSRDERPGEGGCAHLFEHLMFEGSANAPDATFDELLTAGGASNNAWTSEDQTSYHESGPAGALELMLFLESDRLGFLDAGITEVAVANQQDVVLQERAEGYAEPHGQDWDALTRLAWPEGHPYHVPVIGTVEDIRGFSVEGTEAFWARWYRPSNAVMAVVGNVDAEEALDMAERWFSDVPDRGPAPPRAAPLELEARQVDGVLYDDIADHALYLAWPGPPRFSDDDLALSLLADLISYGRGTRLDDALYYERSFTSSAWAWQSSSDLGGLFVMHATTPRMRLRRAERVMERVLRDIASHPPTEAELERAKASNTGWWMQELESAEGRAEWLATCQVYFGDPGCLPELYTRVQALESQDLVDAAERWLTPERRVGLWVVPEGTTRGLPAEVQEVELP